MGVIESADRFQRRHRWAGFPLAVTYKFFDDRGGYLAALITYYGFLSIFPALLLLVTVLGYVLADNPAAQQRILDSAFGTFPVIGTQLEQNISSLQGNATAVAVGVLGLLYGVLGVGQAAQLAFNGVWAVPRNERPNMLRSRVKSLLFVLLIGAGIIATSVLTGLGAATGTLNSHVSALARALILAASAAGNIVLFAAAFRLLTARDVGPRDLLPGALLAAVGWQALQTAGATYFSRVVSRSSDIYGVFGIVLGLFAWLYLGSAIAVIAAEVNVVRACRLWPRSLLAPFADGLPLTTADERAYVSYVKMLKHKSFERIDVRFEQPERKDPARRGADAPPRNGHEPPMP